MRVVKFAYIVKSIITLNLMSVCHVEGETAASYGKQRNTRNDKRDDSGRYLHDVESLFPLI